MTAFDPSIFRLLATHVAGRSVDVAEAPGGQAAYTDGQVVFVSAGGGVAQQRREMLVQSALLGAGSLDRSLVKSLRTRPSVARRYLSVEGQRVIDQLARYLPLAAGLIFVAGPRTATAAESLEVARGRVEVADPPPWFGVIKPSRLLVSAPAIGGRATDQELQLQFRPTDMPEADDDFEDGDRSGSSKILRLFENPLSGSQSLSDYFRKLFGSSRSAGQGGGAGAELRSRAVRRAGAAGPEARPMPTRIRFTDDGKPGAAVGVGGAWHPEWDVHRRRYRDQWCRVIAFPLTAAADVAEAGITRDDVLRSRLSRIGLGPKLLRARPDGDELDVEALTDLFVDLRSGYSPPEHVYLDRRKLERNLGVLILLDASGSATDTDSEGLAVHDHQRRTAATMAATLEELGDRVAVYAFRSHGRHAVHLPAIKTFGQRFGAVGRARLNQLEPYGYTRLGAGRWHSRPSRKPFATSMCRR
ncbi:VWA domain-containing protein [Mycobacterium asiaticum]|uniref:VWA domain-containing protein n=1 Tax=Mycobacterium asiaticum TaxID=1790 RepID=UPI0007EF876B|nr:VWA domain-containing protein [Mycobacterium asiaticum]OBK92074.1 VWA domain-containing protein [Mycobacterium asiaticum]